MYSSLSIQLRMVDDVPSGGRKPRVPGSEIVAFIQESDKRVLTTKEIAEEYSMTSTGMANRLNQLVDEGIIQSRLVGRTKIWWYDDKTATGSSASIKWQEAPEMDFGFVSELDIPGDGEVLRNRRFAVSTVFRYLIMYEQKEPRPWYTRISTVESHDRSFATEQLRDLAWIALRQPRYRDDTVFWNRCIYPALKQTLLFDMNAHKNAWKPTALCGHLVAEHGDRFLWREWNQERDEILRTVVCKFGEAIEKHLDDSEQLIQFEDYPYCRLVIGGSVYPISIDIKTDSSVLLNEPVTLRIILYYRNDEEKIDENLRRTQFHSAKLDFEPDFCKEQSPESGEPILEIRREQKIRLNASTIGSGSGSSFPTKENGDWIIDTIKQFKKHRFCN